MFQFFQTLENRLTMRWVTRCFGCIQTDLLCQSRNGKNPDTVQLRRLSQLTSQCWKLSVIGRSTKYNYLGKTPHPTLRQRSLHTTCKKSSLAEEMSKILGKRLQSMVKSQVTGRKSYITDILYRNWRKIVGGLTVSGGGCWYYYDSHMSEAPITNRRRFMMFNDKQFSEIGECYRRKCMEEFKDDIVSKESTRYTRVLNVANKLLEANLDIPQIHDKKWNLTVVKRDTKDTFALANGHMFVFTGMIDICSNDDQLAVILGHEIAHCILGHPIEMVSLTSFLDMLITAPATAAWSILPSDSISKLTQWLFNKVTDIIVTQPCDKVLENEADEVGMQMVAKACFDVREAPVFWEKLTELSKHESDNDIQSIPAWQEGHAYNEERKQNLENLVPKAIELRLKCDCASLPSRDPRSYKISYQKMGHT